MELFTTAFPMRYIPAVELYSLYLLGKNSFWHTDSLYNNFDATKQLLIIISKTVEKTPSQCLAIKGVIDIEQIIKDNTNNKELTGLTDNKIYENMSPDCKYSKIIAGITKRCEGTQEFFSFYKNLFEGSAVLSLKYNQSIPSFDNIKPMMKWLKTTAASGGVCVSEDVNEFNPTIDHSLFTTLINETSAIQFVYFEKFKKGVKLTIIETKKGSK